MGIVDRIFQGARDTRAFNREWQGLRTGLAEANRAQQNPDLRTLYPYDRVPGNVLYEYPLQYAELVRNSPEWRQGYPADTLRWNDRASILRYLNALLR